jgi:hypothetical protein
MNDAARGVPSAAFRSVFCTLHSALCARQRRDAALTLIEILIAMFIFLVGGLGVLSLFPVAMNNAGRVLGETRGNILAQSVVAQLTADCRVNFELPTTGSAVAGTTSFSATTITRQPATTYPSPPNLVPTSKIGYFVTLLDGPGRGQSRFITGDSGGWGTALTVTPAWTQVVPAVMTGTPPTLTPLSTPWTAPGSLPTYFPIEHYSITRMGLPERPLIGGEQIVQGWQAPPGPYYVSSLPSGYTYGTYGLNRDLVIRAFVPGIPNGFYAGIADWQNSPPTADPFFEYAGNPTAVNNTTGTVVGTLTDTTKTWPVTGQGLAGYHVRIVADPGTPSAAGQVRTVISNTATVLTVTPSWTTLPVTLSSTIYEIGWANTNATNTTPQINTWCAQLYPAPASPLTAPPPTRPGHCNASNTFTNDGASWSANYTGKYVYIYSDTNAGQAYAIVSNNSNTLTVTPAFPTTSGTSGSSTYVITESRGYVLITSGRATNRLFPIAWDLLSTATTGPMAGHLIVCAGANFQSLSGITAAQSGNQYNLQNATTFTVIGNWQGLQGSGVIGWPSTTGTPTMPLILNAIPDGSVIPSAYTYTSPNPPPPWLNTLNTVGYLNPSTNQPGRLALDQYVNNNATTYTSEYSYGVVFSDSGTDPSLPVRVDVFVWRNFDINKDFAQNQKPVGHMTGYIKRP